MCNPKQSSCLAVVICCSVIFVLPSYSVLILIDVQYLQNVVFRFEMGSDGQNQCSSDSHLWIKKSSPHWDGEGIPLTPQAYLENPIFGNSYDPKNFPQDVKQVMKSQESFTSCLQQKNQQQGRLFWPPLISLNSVKKIGLSKVQEIFYQIFPLLQNDKFSKCVI